MEPEYLHFQQVPRGCSYLMHLESALPRPSASYLASASSSVKWAPFSQCYRDC